MPTTVSGSYPAVNSDSDATINGLTVGRGTGAIATNTAVGASALAASATGTENTGIGASALAALTTGSYNTAVGRIAMQLNTTGSQNTAVGRQALNQNLTGSNNTAIGYTALLYNTASNNTAVGYQAGYANTTGGITAVGANALDANTTGGQNVGVGINAFGSNTTGSFNTGVGENSGALNSTGGNNVALGNSALFSNTTASNNTAVGFQAGYANTTGSENVFVGQTAGYNNTTGTLNTFVGYNSGSQVTTGTKNSILGRYNGNQGGLDIRTSSNHIVLSDGDGNPRGIFNSAGELFIGTTATFSYANGKVCINADGSGNPCLVAGVNSTSSATNNIILGNSTGAVGRIQTNGSSTTYLTSSDYRLKSNTAPIQNALSTIERLKPVTFIWNTDNRADAGFLAHEFQEVFPNYADGTKDGIDADGKPAYQAVDKSGAIPYLVKAIQELKAEVDSLKAQLNNGA
jgi:trimeric autotransporter adhesin